MIDEHVSECMVNNSAVTRGYSRRFINISTVADSYKFGFFPRIRLYLFEKLFPRPSQPNGFAKINFEKQFNLIYLAADCSIRVL